MMFVLKLFKTNLNFIKMLIFTQIMLTVSQLKAPNDLRIMKSFCFHFQIIAPILSFCKKMSHIFILIMKMMIESLML